MVWLSNEQPVIIGITFSKIWWFISYHTEFYLKKWNTLNIESTGQLTVPRNNKCDQSRRIHGSGSFSWRRRPDISCATFDIVVFFKRVFSRAYKYFLSRAVFHVYRAFRLSFFNASIQTHFCSDVNTRYNCGAYGNNAFDKEMGRPFVDPSLLLFFFSSWSRENNLKIFFSCLNKQLSTVSKKKKEKKRRDCLNRNVNKERRITLRKAF